MSVECTAVLWAATVSVLVTVAAVEIVAAFVVRVKSAVAAIASVLAVLILAGAENYDSKIAVAVGL